jgi:Spy/CpxP family protein refolding chaperone
MSIVNRPFRKRVVATSVFVLAAFLSSAILAQPAYPRKARFQQGAMMGRMLDHLDLTGEQREQVDEILDRHHRQMTDQAELMRPARLALFDAIHAPVFDEATIRGAAADLAALEADGAVARASFIQEVHQVLTPEQLEQVREHIETARDRHGEFMGCGPMHGHGPGNGHGPRHGAPHGKF